MPKERVNVDVTDEPAHEIEEETSELVTQDLGTDVNHKVLQEPMGEQARKEEVTNLDAIEELVKADAKKGPTPDAIKEGAKVITEELGTDVKLEVEEHMGDQATREEKTKEESPEERVNADVTRERTNDIVDEAHKGDIAKESG